MTFDRMGILVHPEELTSGWLHRMRRAGLNNLGLHPVGGKNAHETLQCAIDSFSSSESMRLRAEAAALGINVEYEAHAMAWLLPRSLFSEHPEWFRMDASGVRIPDFNLCVSNPEALDYVTERCALLASLMNTGGRRYYYWLDDVTGARCHCPECRRLSPSDQQLKAVNAMLRGFRKFRPDAQLCYIAYHDALAAPRKIEPEEGVFLEYAPIRRDAHRPINDPDCALNAREIQPLGELISCFGVKNARVLEYWMDNSLYSNWTKPPKPFALDADVMKRDVEFYALQGFEDATSFGCYLGPDYDALYGETDLAIYADILSGAR